jgi:hypothetical protein
MWTEETRIMIKIWSTMIILFWTCILYPTEFWRSRGSSVSVVSDYGLDDRGSIPGRRKGFFS